jgi:hypothetical protein
MKRAVVLIAAAAACVLAGGVVIAATWHVPVGQGLYCSLGTASTAGCNAAPVSGAGELAAALLMLTAIPLLAAAFGSLHLARVRKHVDTGLGGHHEAIHDRLDEIEQSIHARLDRIEQGTPARESEAT